MQELLYQAQNSMTAFKYLLAVISVTVMLPFAVIGIYEAYHKLYRLIHGPSPRDIHKAVDVLEEVRERAEENQ